MYIFLFPKKTVRKTNKWKVISKMWQAFFCVEIESSKRPQRNVLLNFSMCTYLRICMRVQRNETNVSKMHRDGECCADPHFIHLVLKIHLVSIMIESYWSAAGWQMARKSTRCNLGALSCYKNVIHFCLASW